MRKGEGVHGGIATCLLVGKETRTPVQSVGLSKGGKLIAQELGELRVEVVGETKDPGVIVAGVALQQFICVDFIVFHGIVDTCAKIESTKSGAR